MGSVTDPNTLSPSRLCSDGKSKGNFLGTSFFKGENNRYGVLQHIEKFEVSSRTVEVSKPLCRI